MYYIYIDEAGRGPLAGPVQVGLIIEYVSTKKILRDENNIFPVRNCDMYIGCVDSKILSESKRDELYTFLTKNKNILRSTAKVSANDIDRHGIVWALRQSIMRAMHAHFVGGRFTISGLQSRITSEKHNITLIIDGPSDFGLRKALGVTVIPVIDGDAIIPMISAASIIAKVERDAYMKRLAKRHPQYAFDRHKGYGTQFHYEMIEKYGLCKEHRKSYIE